MLHSRFRERGTHNRVGSVSSQWVSLALHSLQSFQHDDAVPSYYLRREGESSEVTQSKMWLFLDAGVVVF